MIPVAKLFKTMLPVLLSPSVKDCFAVVASVPAAERYTPPGVPAETEATGVPPATFINANFAELVAVDPSSRSSVMLSGESSPFARCQKLIELVEIHAGTPPETESTCPADPIPSRDQVFVADP